MSASSYPLSRTPGSDDPLVHRVRASDLQAFEELFGVYHPILFRQVWFKCRDSALADDITQETFLRVWLHRGSLWTGSSFLALLIRISGNLLKDHLKHEAVKSKHQMSVAGSASLPEDDPETASHLSLLQDAIQEAANRHLPERCRTIFVLSRIEGMDNAEIAEALQIRQKTVENHLNRALRVLRRKLASFLSEK